MITFCCDVSRVTTAPAVVVLVVATKEVVGNPFPVEEVAGVGAPGADQATGCAATNPSPTTWEGEGEGARAEEAAPPSYPNTSHHPSEASHPSAEEEASRYFFTTQALFFNTCRRKKLKLKDKTQAENSRKKLNLSEAPPSNLKNSRK